MIKYKGLILNIVFVFLFAFFVMFLSEKLFGQKAVDSPFLSHPLDWNESFDNMPIYLITSLSFSVIVNLYFWRINHKNDN